MRMILVLSFGGSLRCWHEHGILAREIELYLQYLAQGAVERLYVFSYSHDDDVGLIDAPAKLLQRIRLIRPPRRLRTRLSRLLYSVNPWRLRSIRAEGVEIAKTNQVGGSWVALLLRLFGVRVFARCGYLLSRRHYKNRNYLLLLASYPLESILYRAADLVSVTTEAAAESVRSRIGGSAEKVFVAPTYVDTELFKGDATRKTIETAVIYVGRLEPQKNVLNLVKACRIAGVPLRIIGTGSLETAVRDLAAAIGADIQMTRGVQNDEVAEFFKAYKYYVLPSLHEGLPKSLIEAMSSEMVCIGTDVPGISDLLTDGVTGFLSRGLDEGAIAATIERARSDPSNIDIAKAARAFVVARHSIQTYLDRDRAAIDRWIRPRICCWARHQEVPE
jgi:glycosyltransferase involved in cell wall biosynthesis